MQRAFDFFDANRSGYIDARELRVALGKLGIDVSTRGSYETLRHYDTDSNRRLDIKEFYQLYQAPAAPHRRSPPPAPAACAPCTCLALAVCAS